MPGLFGGEKWIMTSRSAFGYGRGWSSTAFMKLNISVFTPTPSANDVTAMTVKPGVRIEPPHGQSDVADQRLDRGHVECAPFCVLAATR